MRTIEKLQLEQIGSDLCLVFKADDQKPRSILGRISPEKLESLSEELALSASHYRSRSAAGS